jgi:hypothetical protein
VRWAIADLVSVGGAEPMSVGEEEGLSVAKHTQVFQGVEDHRGDMAWEVGVDPRRQRHGFAKLAAQGDICGPCESV